MKKLLLVFYVSLISSMLISINQTINLDYTKTNTKLLQSDNFGVAVNFKFAEISSFDVNTKEGVFSQIAIPGYTHATIIGEPKLPVLRKIISVPLEAEVEVTALDFEISEYSLEEFGIHYPIIPAQPPVPKSIDPSEIEFIYNANAYSINNFTDNELISVEEIGIMRGVRLFILIFEPVKYNPVTGLIKVYNNVNIQVDFNRGNMSETITLREKTFSPYFESVYSKSIFNYSPLKSRDILTRYPVKYIIISDPMFEAQLQPFIEWKIEKGFEIIEAYTNDPGVGSTTASIKNFIQAIYDAATPEDPAPSFILFVGDVAQIPAWSGSTGGHVTDLNYARLEGTDYVPEMYYGRFSANNTTELQPQIDKTLEYERFEMPDPAYLGEVVMIAGMDASHGSTWGNGQINYGTTYYFNEAHGIFSHTYLYPQSGSNSANIIQNVSDGVGYINYTAHGSSTSWADPSFTIPDINGLQNEHEYCLAVGNCCSTNSFEVTTCFGEAWLRAENKGAIGYIGGTNSTYWDEDYWWGVGAGPILSNPTYEQTGLGVYDGLFHDHDEDFSDWTTTTGAMIYRGNLAVTEGGGMVNYYWEIYSIMGDPSLEAYLGVPAVNAATYPSVIFLGLETIQVTAEPYSYVALTMDGEIYGTVLIDETGIVNLEFEAFTNPGIAKLVITRQNHEPVIEEIEVIPSGGPYVIINSYEVHDDNNNIPEYNETITLNVTFENVGIEEALNVNATLSTDDTYVNITSDYVEIGDIAAGEAVTIQDAFEIEVADNIPDQYMIIFDVEIVGSETWNSNINITFNAPDFEIGDMIINDSGGDGILDPGETANLSVPLTNIGHATSQDIFTQLINGTPDLITIIEGSFDLTGLAPEEEGYAEFDIEVDSGVEPGTIAILGFIATSGAYNTSLTFYPPIGLITEDFETGDFSMFDWQMGTWGWQICSIQPYEGTYCAQSEDIGDQQTASISVSMDIPMDGEINFYRKVSSESGWDYLRFYINGQQQGEWSGEVSWAQETYPVSAGNVNFKWAYEKDYSLSSGQDCAWIDYIVFPSISGGDAAIIGINTDEIEFGEVPVGETEVQEFSIFNLGVLELSGTITTPDGFTVSIEESRNEVSYSVQPGENITVQIEFAPTQLITYSGDIIITSNDPNQAEVLIPVSGTGVSTGNDPNHIPLVTKLNGNYPNPFNPTTTLSYSLNEDSKVTLEIYNIKGQKVKTLVNKEQPAGYYKTIWNGKDNNNRNVASGIYFYKMKAGGRYTSTRKMILMK